MSGNFAVLGAVEGIRGDQAITSLLDTQLIWDFALCMSSASDKTDGVPARAIKVASEMDATVPGLTDLAVNAASLTEPTVSVLFSSSAVGDIPTSVPSLSLANSMGCLLSEGLDERTDLDEGGRGSGSGTVGSGGTSAWNSGSLSNPSAVFEIVEDELVILFVGDELTIFMSTLMVSSA